jgi:G:T/U-mismatch repair DNA glycosylase
VAKIRTAKIRHLSADHVINPETEILVIGTFNPGTPLNEADFFYGRRRNFLWQLLPLSFGEASFKGKGREEKISFMKRRHIDFVDIISEVDVDDPSNYDDSYIDGKVSQWRNVIAEIAKLPRIKRACLTRKTFADIPNMKKKINEIREYCEKQNILFRALISPARIYSAGKQAEWAGFFNGE